MKKIITIILLIAVLLSCAGCEGIADMPKKDYGEYPTISAGDGYTVEGKVVDYAGNPLPGVNVFSGGKVRGVTNQQGEYKVTSLSGETKISVKFGDYEFDRKEIAVSSATNGINFVGKNSYSLGLSSSVYNNRLFGVTYVVNGKAYAEDENGVARVPNLNGATVVSASHPNFDFTPSKMTVYDGNSQSEFKATPKIGMYAVSGYVDIKQEILANGDPAPMPELYIAVDGKITTSVVEEYYMDEMGNEQKRARYYIYGLDPKKSGGYQISLVDASGNPSAQVFTVTEGNNALNFKYMMKKKIDIQVIVNNMSDIMADADQQGLVDYVFDWKDLDYNVYVKDEDGNIINEYRRSGEFIRGLSVWEGCTVYIEGDYDDRDMKTEYEFSAKLAITKYVMDRDPEDGAEYYLDDVKIRLKLIEEDD